MTNSIEKISMEPLVSILAELEKSGYKTQFKAVDGGLLSLSSNKTYQTTDVEVNHFYRFEGESNPDDSAILYAIETNNGEKGTLIDGYGIASDTLVTKFMHDVLKIHK